jgi:ribose transport system permease protein
MGKVIDRTSPLTTNLNKVSQILKTRRDISLLFIIVIMVLVITQITPYFLTVVNMRTLGLAIAFNGIVVIGMTILMIGGGIDLSVGSVFGFASIIVGIWVSRGLPLIPGLMVGLLVGAVIGFINAKLVNRFMLSPFLATLGTMTIFRGLISVISGGHSIVGLSKTFSMIGQTRILGIQAPVYIMFLLIIIFDFLLRRSTFFKQVFYIGINRESARSVGISVAGVTSIAYVLSGVLAAFAGILDGARLGAVYIQSGIGLEFQVITATVIGGTALTGGKGSIFGSLLGVIIMAILTNVFNLIGLNIYWQSILVGVILVTVVAIDRLTIPKESR